MTWRNDRTLQAIGNTSFTYDGEGQRVSKTTNGVTTEYIYEGDKLVMQKQGNTSLFFLYDTSGIFGFDHIVNGTTIGTYYYHIDGILTCHRSIIMKKIGWIIFCICCAVFFGGCRSNSVRYELMQDPAQIASIQIAKGLCEKDAFEGNYDQLKPVASIPDAKWEMFLAEFRTIRCSQYRNDPCQSLEGHIIWITYTDGSFELIGDCAAFYHEIGESDRGSFRPYYFDIEQFSSLIKQHIES